MFVSIFPNPKSKPSGKKHINDLLNAIKYGQYKEQVEAYRAMNFPDDKAKREYKVNKFEAFTTSGIFKERKIDGLERHSGLICIDIDKQEITTELRQKIDKDKYTYSSFVSLSGKGLAVIIKISPDFHKESFEWLAEHYFNSYGLILDPAPTSVASTRTVSYDPDLTINENSKVSPYKKKEKALPTLPHVCPKQETEALILSVTENITETYSEYLAVCFAIADEFGEEGRHLADHLCQKGSKYSERAFNAQYTACLKAKNTNKITIGSLFHTLKNLGYELPKSNDKAVVSTAFAKKNGKTKEQAVALLTNTTDISEAEAVAVVEAVYTRPEIDLTKVSSTPEKLIENVLAWLHSNHKIRFNIVSKKYEDGGVPLEDERINTIFLRVKSVFNSNSVTKQLVEACLFSEFTEKYNPFDDFWAKTKPSANYIGTTDRFIQAVKTSTPNAHLWLKKWLVSIMACMDSEPIRSYLVFVGAENNGKTKFFSGFKKRGVWHCGILPLELQNYFANYKFDETQAKDDAEVMCTKLIILDDEIKARTEKEASKLKERTSKEVYTFRASYAKTAKDYNRIALLCGCSNNRNLLNQDVGITRMLCIEVDSIDFRITNAIDRIDLMHDLRLLYESDFEYELTADEIEQLRANFSRFEKENIYADMLALKFTKEPENDQKAVFLTAMEIKEYIESTTKQSVKDYRLFTLECTKFFGQSKARREGGAVIKKYECFKIWG